METSRKCPISSRTSSEEEDVAPEEEGAEEDGRSPPRWGDEEEEEGGATVVVGLVLGGVGAAARYVGGWRPRERDMGHGVALWHSECDA